MKLNELEGFPELGNTVVIDGIEYVKKREPLSGKEISYGFRTNDADLDAESYWARVKWAEKMHGIGGGE